MSKLAIQNLAGAQRAGCKHYQRKCCFIAPCCKKMYVCRLCHNESESHEMERTQVTEIVCMVCRQIQQVNRKCSACNTVFGEYFCEKCRLYDDDVTKGQFHCDGCGLCRLGGRANYFHCETCSICFHLNLKNNHQERNLKCSYRDSLFLSSEKSVRHCISGHREEKVPFRIFSSTRAKIEYKCRTFKLFGKDVLCDPQLVTYSDDTGKLHIPNVTSTESPLRKMLKVNTPTKSVHRQLFSQDPLDENNEYTVNDIDSASSYSDKNESLSFTVI